MSIEVDLFSIPALDASGSPERVSSALIDSSKLALAGGEILVSKLNPRKPRVHLISERLELESVCSTEFVVLAPRDGTDRRFLAYSLRAESVRQELDSQVRSATRSHQRVEPSVILSTRVYVPGFEEQRRIADFLDDQVARVDNIIAARLVQRERLEALWGAALDRAFREQSIMTIRLGRLATVQSGLTINDREQRGLEDGTSLPYLSVANVKDGYLDLAAVKEATVSPGQVSRHILQPGDVLMTEGGDLDKLGRGSVWSGEIEPCLHQNHVFAVRPHDGVLDPWYLTLFSQSRPARGHFMLTASKSTNLASTSASKVQALAVPLRAISEQRAIAASLKRQREELDRAGSYLDRSSELLAEYKQSLITAAVTGELDVTTASGGSLPA